MLITVSVPRSAQAWFQRNGLYPVKVEVDRAGKHVTIADRVYRLVPVGRADHFVMLSPSGNHYAEFDEHGVYKSIHEAAHRHAKAARAAWFETTYSYVAAQQLEDGRFVHPGCFSTWCSQGCHDGACVQVERDLYKAPTPRGDDDAPRCVHCDGDFE